MKPKRERGNKGWLVGLAIIAAAVLSGCGSYSGAAANDMTSNSGDSGGSGTTVTALHSSPKELAVGDAMVVDLSDAAEQRVDFSGVDANAKFIVALGSYGTSGTNSSVQISGDVSLPEVDPASKAMGVDAEAVPENEGYGPEEMMSAWLRANEAVLADSEIPAEPAMKSMSVKAAAVAGGESFRVLSSLTAVNSYVNVTGNVRCEKDAVVFYVDASVPDSVLNDDDINTLCAEFNRVVVEEQQIFGATSDVDGDGKLHVLMTSQINKLGALGGGVVTGYFYAGDLYERSDSNQVSNHREIIYTMVPDESGQYGYSISKEFAMQNLLPAVLPHELQHAISYNQHVFVNGGQPEENGIGEGLSHLAEDIMGHNRENPSRYALYLASPSTYGFVTQGSPNLMERGAAYLFLRFLYEQANDGNAFLHALETSSLRGIANIEAAFSGPADLKSFPDFVSRWVIALAMTDRGISSDSRFIYRPRVKDVETGDWTGVILSGDAEDGRGTILTGVNLNSYSGNSMASVDSGTAKFYDLSTVPDALTLSGSAGGGNFAALIRYQ